MKSFTLVLQVLGIALIAPSWGRPQRSSGHYQALVKSQPQPFATRNNGDYALSQGAAHSEEPLRIIAAEPRTNETREEFVARKRLQEEELRHQAETAKYSFATSLSDRIMDGEHLRSETREGLKTRGSYSYSDGYVRRTVEYIADENGYRVIKQTEEPIGNGPQPDPTGSADISAYYDRSQLQYSITADDIRGYHNPEEEEEEEGVTEVPLVAAFARSSVPRVAPIPVPVQTPSPVSTTAPVHRVVPTEFNTEQILRPAERHDIQVPIRPLPQLRGQYFTHVHAL